MDRLHLIVTPETIRKYLLSAGFIRRKPTHTLVLDNDHIELRFNWAKKYLNFLYSPEIIFTDECSIWLFDNNREGWFHSKVSSPLSVDKHCGKIHCWGAINMLVGKVAFMTFRCNMDGRFYKTIIQQTLIPNANRLLPGGYILQQDGNSSHTSKVAMKYIREEVPMVMDWPSKSPDLNPIENVWSILKRNVRKRMVNNLNELERHIHEEWENFSNQKIILTCESFPKRVEEFFRLRGKKTNY